MPRTQTTVAFVYAVCTPHRVAIVPCPVSTSVWQSCVAELQFRYTQLSEQGSHGPQTPPPSGLPAGELLWARNFLVATYAGTLCANKMS